MKMLEEIKSFILQSEIISFDLFDTLVVRPYWKPEDLFLHLEYLYKASGFAKERIKAEILSRKKLGFGVETTLERIYQYIPEKYKFLKDKELELEYETLQVNSEILELFDYAKSLNKKVIITSDMYLPLDFIEKVLSKNRIRNYNKIYLSSEYKKTKISGKLYKQIMSDFKILPKNILHIGDNKISDYFVPKMLGIKTFLYTKVKHQFIKDNSVFKKLSKKKNLSLGLSISLSVCAINFHKQKYLNKNQNYFYNLGFNIGGLLAYSFCKFAVEYVKEKNIEQVFFVARGGFTLEKVFNLLSPEIKTDYVVLSRIQNTANKILNIQGRDSIEVYEEKFILYKLLSYINKVLHLKILNKIIYKFYPTDENLYSKLIIFLKKIYHENKIFQKINFSTDNNYKKFYKENKNELNKLLFKEQKIFYDYLKNKSFNANKILIIDDSAATYSAQKLCIDLLNIELYGLYFRIFSKTTYDNIFAIEFSNNKIKLFDWEFMEFLFTAPNPPILGIDKQFNIIYEKSNNYEQKRIEIYKYVSTGMVDFAKEIKKAFNSRTIFMTSKDAGLWINNFFKNYTKSDYNNMLDVYTTPDQTRYFPLFSYKPTFKEILSNPIKYIYNCSHVIAPTLLQRILSFPIMVLRYIVNYY